MTDKRRLVNLRTARRENPINKLLTVAAVDTIMQNNGINLKVNDINIYRTAFIHRSYLRTHYSEAHDPSCLPLQDTCNETYEYLGDTILNSVIGTYLYDRYRDQNEGFLTKTRTKMVRGTTLGELAKRLGLHHWIVISQHVESEGGRDNPRILEDLFEAFIAAIYLDNGSDPLSDSWLDAQSEADRLSLEISRMEAPGGLDTPQAVSQYVSANSRLRQLYGSLVGSRSNGYLFCQRFIISTYEGHMDISKLIAYDDNYKDQLQHYFQQQSDTFPVWELIKEEGKTNNRWHTVGVKDRYGYLIATGKARKKTEAEQLASKNVLIQLGVISADHGDDFFH
jgi:dsRNA-specific ribonuclease